MLFLLQKTPFLIELFFNGSFFIFFFLKKFNKLPDSLPRESVTSLLETGANIVPLIILLSVIVNYLNSNRIEDFFRKHIFSLLVFVPLVLTWGDVEFAFWLSAAHLFSSILSLYGDEEEKLEVETTGSELGLVERYRFKPAQVVLISFIGVILAGTVVLMLPLASSTGKSIPFVDALFMATSATCVTGLSTLSLANDFSILGQVVVLILIQIGGLGFMILYSSMTIFLGKSMDMKYRILMQDLLNVSSLEDLIEMIVDIIKYTIVIEIWGAIILTIAFTFEGYEFGRALYYGFFHSISAFCNAGFALFDNSLESFATNPLINGTIGSLLVLGGLGFVVLKEVKITLLAGKRFRHLGLHSKVVLVTSLFLTLLGAFLIFFGEFLNALDSYHWFDKVQISLLQSMTLRTAGFNTIPLTGLHTYIIYIMTLFMYIGACPGSTGGGIKVTTVAILFQSIKSTLKGRDKVEIYDRNIPSVVVVKATALIILSISVASFFIFLLMKFEPEQEFLSIFFEVASASGTVGLSLGITPFLSAIGKICIGLLMFIGRIGPLTMVLAIGETKASRGGLDYPDGRIMIG